MRWQGLDRDQICLQEMESGEDIGGREVVLDKAVGLTPRQPGRRRQATAIPREERGCAQSTTAAYPSSPQGHLGMLPNLPRINYI